MRQQGNIKMKAFCLRALLDADKQLDVILDEFREYMKDSTNKTLREKLLKDLHNLQSNSGRMADLCADIARRLN